VNEDEQIGCSTLALQFGSQIKKPENELHPRLTPLNQAHRLHIQS
jgi:hypothetical protein